ncbi:unnamed protein product [Prorocentrum cordatum]|uniref:PPM-type phosphatase domain-containing protein n=1 Tax=Prorocentrum cordatum TaxID=2364126 RepID=A0ABN9UKM9_9DINO|nr:unnamed protein product [Polarella glacialis]
MSLEVYGELWKPLGACGGFPAALGGLRREPSLSGDLGPPPLLLERLRAEDWALRAAWSASRLPTSPAPPLPPGLCVVGNVGDSEVIIGTRRADGVSTLEVLTEVHRIRGNAAEAARVEALGGRVWKGRVGHPRLNPKFASLAVSRAIGDLFFKDAAFTQGKASGLVADPHVTSVQVRGEGVSEQFLLLGCDGFWDKVTYQQALSYVFRLMDTGTERSAGDQREPRDLCARRRLQR